MKVLNLIILGPQGSGKTTQAELLAQKFGFVLLGAGDVLREIAREDTELGKIVRQTINVEGRLVQPELISKVIKERVGMMPSDRGLVLDGYPRSVRQYELFKEFWPQTGRGDYLVVFLDLSREEAVKRLASRETCANCGTAYVEGTTEQCVKCGGRLVRRPDDNPEAIQRRLESFYSETMPMIHTMEADGSVLHVDGGASIDEVHQKIASKLG